MTPLYLPGNFSFCSNYYLFLHKMEFKELKEAFR